MVATTFTSEKECNGFVGYYPTDNEIVVSFSGTDPLNIRMWIDDLDFFKTDYPLCSDLGCQVHEGFYKTYLSAVDQIRNLTNSYLTQYPTASLTCTGHSLGAALAALCAADMNDIYSDRPDLLIASPYIYGLPRLGDDTFANWFKKSGSLPFDTYRVVHRKDPVPQLPLQSMGFHHFPYEVFYIEDYSKYTVCSADGEDENCSDQYHLSEDVLNHLHYLGFDFTTNFLNCEL
jgi:predicted lipase